MKKENALVKVEERLKLKIVEDKRRLLEVCRSVGYRVRAFHDTWPFVGGFEALH